MKRILFTTEFSDHAPHVFRYALELARVFAAKIILGHGFGRPDSILETKDDEEKKAYMLKRLQDFAAEHTPAELRTVSMEFAAELDYPADAILKMAKTHQADVIVMSMTGKSADPDLHFSDTTLRVLQRADCPVVAVPAEARFAGMRKMVCTTDFNFNDLIALNVLRRWSYHFNAAVHVLHVLEEEAERPAAAERLNALREAYQHDTNMSFSLTTSESTRKSILDFVDKHHTELLVMTTGKRSGLSAMLDNSLTRKVARSVQCPLMVIKNWDDVN